MFTVDMYQLSTEIYMSVSCMDTLYICLHKIGASDQSMSKKYDVMSTKSLPMTKNIDDNEQHVNSKVVSITNKKVHGLKSSAP